MRSGVVSNNTLFKQLTFRVKDEAFDQINQLARANNITIAEQARRLCYAALKLTVIEGVSDHDSVQVP